MRQMQIASYIILLDDMKSIMKAMLRTFANDDSENIEAKKAALKEFDWAEEAGYTLDNPDFQILYMANVESIIYDEEGNEKEKYNF